MRQAAGDGARRADEHAAGGDAVACRATTCTARSGRPSSPAATPSTSRCSTQGLLVVLGDATGHGIAPALSVTQMQAMLRMAFRLGADLETAFVQVNNQLAETLADDRFITAFIGVLDPATHQLRFHSGGQGPILHFRAADATLRALQADELSARRDAADGAAAGDRARRCSRATCSSCSPTASTSTRTRAASSSAKTRVRGSRSPRTIDAADGGALARRCFDAVQAFAEGAPQEDDMTVVLVKREAGLARRRSFRAQLRRAAQRSSRSPRRRSDRGARRGCCRRRLGAGRAVHEHGQIRHRERRAGAHRHRARSPDGVEVTLIDTTSSRSTSRGRPTSTSRCRSSSGSPAGSGLHLIRSMVDSVEYRYSSRRSRHRAAITLQRKTEREQMLAIERVADGDGRARRDGSTRRSARPRRRFSTRSRAWSRSTARGLEYISSAGLGVLLRPRSG